MGINIVVLVGRLTADPQLKATSNGTEVTSFNIAVDDKFKKDKTYFINCVAWRQTAKFITDYFKKGTPISLTGFIQTDTYKDESGKWKTSTVVVVEQVSFVPKTSTPSEEAPKQSSQQASNDYYTEFDDIDVPF